MIKLKGNKKIGYILGFTNWPVYMPCGQTYEKLALTEAELKALYLLLDKHFMKFTRKQINTVLKQCCDYREVEPIMYMMLQKNVPRKDR